MTYFSKETAFLSGYLAQSVNIIEFEFFSTFLTWVWEDDYCSNSGAVGRSIISISYYTSYFYALVFNGAYDSVSMVAIGS